MCNVQDVHPSVGVLRDCYALNRRWISTDSRVLIRQIETYDILIWGLRLTNRRISGEQNNAVIGALPCLPHDTEGYNSPRTK